MVKHTFSAQAQGIRKTEGRVRVCREEVVVGGKRRSRPRRQLSKGVRFYYHFNDGAVIRESYNAAVGLRGIWAMKAHGSIRAIGTEEGAVVIHYQIPKPSWSAYAVQV